MNRLSALYIRRLDFAHTEAVSPDGKYDQTISVLLRALSNLATVGFDGSSFAVKCKNPRMSVEAKKLRLALQDDKEWASRTINEHPKPLKDLWSEWRLAGQVLTRETIWSDLCSHPMITITKSEDDLLREVSKMKKSFPTPTDRYDAAGIKLDFRVTI